jgi:rhamnogalacturonan endolyase
MRSLSSVSRHSFTIPVLLATLVACSGVDDTGDGAGATGGSAGSSPVGGSAGAASGGVAGALGGGSGVGGAAGGAGGVGGAAGSAGLAGAGATGGVAGTTPAGGSAGTVAGASGSAGLAGGAGGASGDAGASGAGTSGAGGTPPVAADCGRNPSLATGKVWMENLCRGVVAVRSGSNNFVSWRMFGYEPDTISYNVYRDGTKVTASPITDSTNYVDSGAPAGATYTVRAVLDGTELGDSEAATTWGQNYIDIELDPPQGYTPGDASVGDLDGDGQYEIVLKWEMNPQDNSNAGTTGTVKLEGLEFDGTSLWRLDLGRNIREGAHYTQFVVYDMDGDGDAEIVVKTAPGTVDGMGQDVILGNDDPDADYRNGDGYILSGPEYVTIFDGRNGAELSTQPFAVPRGNVGDWGDTYGNRVDRFTGAMAFVTDDGRPSALMGRGYYTRSTITAWNYRDGSFAEEWTSDSDEETNWEGQGSHGLSIADVDGDDRQEVIYGASMITADGTRGCTTNRGHGDALHVGDLIPSRPGLEVFMPHESGSSLTYTMRDAATCALIYQGPGNGGDEGPGRGAAADVSPDSPGAEAWTNSSTMLSTTGGNAGSRPASTNFLVWWDGDESRELLDGNHVDKYGGSRLLTADGCSSINGTKSTPNLSGDMIGDWREEILFRCGTNLRLYTTTTPTTRRIYTLMHDPMYRSAISWQNTEYNQPPHPSFHIGDGMAEPPKPNITVR